LASAVLMNFKETVLIIRVKRFSTPTHVHLRNSDRHHRMVLNALIPPLGPYAQGKYRHHELFYKFHVYKMQNHDYTIYGHVSV
jgi:hypothetical protein